MAKHVFIVEDDPGISEIMEMLFLEEGFQVSLASDSKAINRITDELPDLILVDLHLDGSEKDGLEICYELKGHHRTQDIPLLLVSAERNLAQLAGDCRANGHITKPFNIGDLVDEAKRHLEALG